MSDALRRSATLAAITIVCAVGLVGCAARKAYDDGLRQMRAGDYDRAVRSLEDAVRRSPDKQTYQDALAEACAKAAQGHLAAPHNHWTKRNLQAAEKELKSVFAFAPNDAEAKTLHEQVRAARSAALAKSSEAIRLAEAKQWDASLASLDDAVLLDQSLPGSRETANRIGREAASYFIDLAREALGRGQLSEAEQHAERSLDYDSHSSDAASILNEAARRKAAIRLVESGSLHFAAGRYNNALRDFTEADQSFSTSESRQAIQRTHIGLAETFAADAQAQFERQSWGHALLFSLIANHFKPQLVPATRLSDCVDRISDDLQYGIAVIATPSPRDPTGAISDSLVAAVIEETLRQKSPHVSIVEREDLEAILNEQDMSVSDIVSMSHRQLEV
ncbi:MAG: hypothetical protein WBE26_18860 [Phycisphaerae bacterium]